MKQRIEISIAEQNCHETAMCQKITQRNNDNIIIPDRPISATTISED